MSQEILILGVEESEKESWEKFFSGKKDINNIPLKKSLTLSFKPGGKKYYLIIVTWKYLFSASPPIDYEEKILHIKNMLAVDGNIIIQDFYGIVVDEDLMKLNWKDFKILSSYQELKDRFLKTIETDMDQENFMLIPDFIKSNLEDKENKLNLGYKKSPFCFIKDLIIKFSAEKDDDFKKGVKNDIIKSSNLLLATHLKKIKEINMKELEKLFSRLGYDISTFYQIDTENILPNDIESPLQGKIIFQYYNIIHSWKGFDTFYSILNSKDFPSLQLTSTENTITYFNYEDITNLCKYLDDLTSENKKTFFVFDAIGSLVVHPIEYFRMGLLPLSNRKNLDEIKKFWSNLILLPEALPLLAKAGGVGDFRNYMIFLSKGGGTYLRGILNNYSLHHVISLDSVVKDKGRDEEYSFSIYLEEFFEINDAILKNFDRIVYVSSSKDNDLIGNFFKKLKGKEVYLFQRNLTEHMKKITGYSEKEIKNIKKANEELYKHF